jgi:predicted dehydrogenase
MAKTINVAVLTHAGGAHVIAYLQALAVADACAEVTLADPDRKWEEDAKRILGKKLTGVDRDHAKILDQHQPAMALVTMEAKLAPPVIDLAFDHDGHVFAEKPACVDPKDFAPLVKKADGKHRHLMLALANRLNPELLAAKKLIADGTIGKIYALEMNLVADQARLKNPAYHQTWFAHKDRAGGGHLLWLGIHWLDLAMHLTQSPIVDVAGFTANVGGQPTDVEDAAAAALRFENGCLGTMTSGYYLDKGYHSGIKIWGADGWLHLEQMKDQPLHWYTHNGPDAGKIIPWTGNKQPRGYTPFVQRAVEACADLAEPPISNADSLRALNTVFAIYQAAQTGQTVKIQ